MRGGGGLVAGLPVPEIALRILREPWDPAPLGALSRADFEHRCAGPDAPGEIVVHGGHVLTGYLGGRGDGDTKFRVDGEVWHRTGDAGYLDATGRLWLLGRCSARVADGEGVLYPFAVECAAMHCAGVARAAFTSAAGRRLLLVEPMPGHAPDLAEVSGVLGWARLHEIREYAAIPVDRRHNAKIDYTALPALVGSRPQRHLTLSHDDGGQRPPR